MISSGLSSKGHNHTSSSCLSRTFKLLSYCKGRTCLGGVRKAHRTVLSVYQNSTSSSAVAKSLCDASCLSVVSFNSTKHRVDSFIVSYVGS